MASKEQRTFILSLEDIACWWLPVQLDDKAKKLPVKADLPALQRGFVWQPEQIERLWDSIAQGFPIGSLMLAKLAKLAKNDDNQTHRGVGADGTLDGVTHQLLDGQQRATAIALGFRDIWSVDAKNTNELTHALWVDLKPLEGDERQFAFRVVTRAHPWGYSRTDPSKTLSAAKARDALVAYRMLNGDPDQKPHKFRLSQVFPWDAEAPVPLALLIGAIQASQNSSTGEIVTSQVKEALLQKMKGTALFNAGGEPSDEGKITSEKTAEIKKAIEKIACIKKAIEEVDDRQGGFVNLVQGLHDALLHTEVPALQLNPNMASKDENLNQGDKEDEKEPVFSLFKRLNTGGTTLSREDINYSKLKSKWPDARKIIEEDILKHRQIAQPARMAMLLVRLYRTKRQHGVDKQPESFTGLCPSMSVDQFRKWIDREDNKKEFEKFCEVTVDEKGLAKIVVDKFWEFVTHNTLPKEKIKACENYWMALPTVLAARLFRQSDDLVLLYMYWILKLDDKGQISEIEVPACHKRSLGFLTAIAWFAVDIKACVDGLAAELVKQNSDLVDFFNSSRFRKLIKIDENKKPKMLPLIPPDILVKNGKVEGDYESLWGLWGGEKTPTKMEEWFQEKLYGSDKPDENRVNVRDLWWKFIEKIHRDPGYNRLLYAQREFIQNQFGWYDVTRPDQITDHNRPWDYDHILPYNWVKHSGSRSFKKETPKKVRVWVNSIGNFRAWPYELNRSKGDKLIVEGKATDYELNDIIDVCKASFMDKNNQYGDWKNLVDEENGIKENGWNEFIDLAWERTVDIYRVWYEDLKIKNLMSDEH